MNSLELPLLVLVDSPTNSDLCMNCIFVLSTNTPGPSPSALETEVFKIY